MLRIGKTQGIRFRMMPPSRPNRMAVATPDAVVVVPVVPAAPPEPAGDAVPAVAMASSSEPSARPTSSRTLRGWPSSSW